MDNMNRKRFFVNPEFEKALNENEFYVRGFMPSVGFTDYLVERSGTVMSTRHRESAKTALDIQVEIDKLTAEYYLRRDIEVRC